MKYDDCPNNTHCLAYQRKNFIIVINLTSGLGKEVYQYLNGRKHSFVLVTRQVISMTKVSFLTTYFTLQVTNNVLLWLVRWGLLTWHQLLLDAKRLLDSWKDEGLVEAEGASWASYYEYCWSISHKFDAWRFLAIAWDPEVPDELSTHCFCNDDQLFNW